MLRLVNAQGWIGGKKIVGPVSFSAAGGSVCALLGANGSGKSTLLGALAGKNGIEAQGEIWLNDENVAGMSAFERARKGIFLAAQTPVEIPGLSLLQMAKACVNEVRQAQGKEPWDAFEFMDLAKKTAALAGLDEALLKKPVGGELSGGQKKKTELWQMALFEPKVILLDEIDSGLDVDAMKAAAQMILREKERGALVIAVSHYASFLEELAPDMAIALRDGEVRATGGKELAERLGREGYGSL